MNLNQVGRGIDQKRPGFVSLQKQRNDVCK